LVIGVGLVCVFRRRWAAALFHTVPLGLVYLAWMSITEAQAVLEVEGSSFTLVDYGRWMNSAAAGLFMAVGFFAPLAVAVALVLVGGAVLAWRSEGGRAFLERASIPAALVVSCIITMSTAAPSRHLLGFDQARASRYLGVMAALMLPAIAVGADAIARRWPRATPALLALFLVPVPFNAAQFERDPILNRQYFEAERTYIAGLPEHPLTAQVPPWVRPNHTLFGQPDMTVGWLRQARREGALPPHQDLPPAADARLRLQLGVAMSEDEPPEGLTCTTQRGVVGIDPRVGDRWYLETPATVAERAGFVASSSGIPLEKGTVEVTLPDLHLVLQPAAGREELVWCH
jgi:hypothetical protein